jgi:hypothetical protein
MQKSQFKGFRQPGGTLQPAQAMNIRGGLQRPGRKFSAICNLLARSLPAGSTNGRNR